MTKYVELNKLGSLSRGKSKHRPRNDKILFENGDIPFIQTSDVKDAYLYINHADTFYNKKGLAQSYLWKKDTLCITIAANIAETALLGIEACFPDSIVGFINDKSKCDIKYIKYCFDVLKNTYQQVSHGTSQENLNIENLNTLLIPYVNLERQHHIVDIIGSIDEQIESCKKINITLENLLSLKFKHKFGNIFDDTKQMTTLDTYLDYIDGYAFKPEKYDDKGKYNIITIKNVKNLEIDDNFENKINEIYYLPKNIIVNKGDILLSMTGNAGRVAINHLDNVLLNQRVAKIFCKIDKSDIFIYCLMKEKNMENYIMSISSGTSQKNLSMLDLFKTKINIIPNKKITSFQQENEVIWNKIMSIKIKIKKLKDYKNILLPLLLNEQVL